MIKYTEYLKSTVWANTRLRILEDRKFKCQKCWTSKYLVVHHWNYEKLWNEPNSHLFALCDICHQIFHNKYWTSENMLEETNEFIKKIKIKWKKKIRIKTQKIKTAERFKAIEQTESKRNTYKVNKKFKYL